MGILVSDSALLTVPGESDVRADRLIQVADELLDESGLEGLTIRAVLLRSGLARRAFYEQFNGKDDLVLAVFERTLRLAAEHFRRTAERSGDPLAGLHGIVRGLVEGELGMSGSQTGRRSAALSREHLRLAEARPDDLQTALAPLLGLIAELVEQGVAQGLIRPCDPDLHARLIYNFVAATVHVELLAEEGGGANQVRRKVLTETIWEFCRRALVV